MAAAVADLWRTDRLPLPSKRMKKKTLWLTLLVLAVYLLHQDFWNWQTAGPLLFGFLPVGLWYHAAYSVLAAALMTVLVKFAWPRELEELEADPEAPPPAAR
jgi:hypothetical protein